MESRICATDTYNANFTGLLLLRAKLRFDAKLGCDAGLVLIVARRIGIDSNPGGAIESYRVTYGFLSMP